jgi:hypothetical protein
VSAFNRFILFRDFVKDGQRNGRANPNAYMVCYENGDFSGDELRLREYTPYFYIYNFDNRARSCCMDGM